MGNNTPLDARAARCLPVSFQDLEPFPLTPFDLLGRHKIDSEGCVCAQKSTEAEMKEAARSACLKIEVNNFKFKSLSCWNCNISVGCIHGCRFCSVPYSQRTAPGKENENTGALAKTLRAFGVPNPDRDWGGYVLLRPWDEARFVASLRKAEQRPRADLNPDGNRAVIFCSTTDPYQAVSIPEFPQKQNLLNAHRRFLVRRALELILEESTLNVRILTRSPLAQEDFDLYEKFGNRILFGMSLPNLNDRWLKVYEPHAPGPQVRLRTLKKAADRGIPLYVAVAPTYPECDEEDLRATLTAIRPLNPLTVFHEPINIRAENAERIAEHAAEMGVKLKVEVFDNVSSWRAYAVEQFMMMQRIATELGMAKELHLWPDKSLKSLGGFIKARQFAFRQAHPGYRETAYEKGRRRFADEAAFVEFERWLSAWHARISEWPGNPTRTV